MVLTVFRSRLRPEAQAEYTEWAGRMGELVVTMPGYRSHKTFSAADGERVTLVEFESAEALQAWATHPEHVAAKRLGRERFYLSYDVMTCEPRRHVHFSAEDVVAP